MKGYVTDPQAPDGLRLADDQDEPQPAPDELVLDVRASSVNRGELFLLTQRTEGWRPGQDVAGIVVHAAADGSGPREGGRVVGIVEGAGWSERVAVPTLHAAPLDEAVAFEEAASLPIAGLTALRALRAGGDLLGRRVLVTGATGGVGSLAVQLGIAAGADVVAQVSGPEREQEALDLGALAVVWDLEDDDGPPFDVVLDGVGGPTLVAALHRMRPGATAVTYGTVGGKAELNYPDWRNAPQARIVGLSHAVPQDEKGADLATLARFVADGRLRPRLGMVEDWRDIGALLAGLRDRQIRGKAILTRS